MLHSNLDDLQDTMDDIKDHGEFIEEIQRITTTPFADEFDEVHYFYASCIMLACNHKTSECMYNLPIQ